MEKKHRLSSLTPLLWFAVILALAALVLTAVGTRQPETYADAIYVTAEVRTL